MMHEFEQMMDEDAVAFELLSKPTVAQGHRGTDRRARKDNGSCAEDRRSVPLKIMERTSEALDLLAEPAEKERSL